MDELENMLIRAARLDESFIWFKSWYENPQLKIFVINLIQENQLQFGFDENGRVIGYYSRATEIITGGFKEEGSPYNLNDTGKFYESMFVKAFLDSIEIEAESIKENDDLFEKFGDGIIGLTDDSISKLSFFLLPIFTQNVKRYLLG